GLAGMRIGYGVAPQRLADAIRKCALPFGVTSIAQEAAVASLDATEALLERVDAIVAERERVVSALRAQGWDVPDTQANFFWLALGDAAVDFAAACADDGLMVRPFAGDGVRVTVGEPEANDLLLQAAESWRRR